MAIFTSALFEFTEVNDVELWATSECLPIKKNVRQLGYGRLRLVPLLLREGFNRRIIDSFHFLIEYPSSLMVPCWVLLKLLLRFEWIKVVHDGSLPSRYKNFGLLRRVMFRLSVNSVDVFATVNDDINNFLRSEIGVRQQVKTMNALLPLPKSDLKTTLPDHIEQALARYDKIVVSTGVFVPDYGFAHAAEAVERVRLNTGENIGLMLIDGGFIRDEAYRDHVLRNREWIVPLERVPHPQVLQIFRRSNVFVRGFRYEGYGLSRIEALWCGIPVIAAMGEESRGMFLYEFGDLNMLIAHLNEALANPSMAEVDYWGDVFQRQAEKNLEAWKEMMGLPPQ